MPFLDSLDIGNRALQRCGATQIIDVDEDSQSNNEVAFVYDKVRRAELRRNVWRFAIRNAALRAIDTTTRLLVPNDYDATKTYLPGSIVKDDNGQLWISFESDNLNNTPGDTDVWDMYFGPLTVSLYDSGTSYFAGDIVYKESATAGLYSVYLSIESGNDDAPDEATAWDSTATYGEGAGVSHSGSQWRSLIPVNTGVTPADGPLDFDPTATYSASDTVTGSDHVIYSSVGSGNIGHDPTTDGGVHWTDTGVVNGWSRTPTLAVSSTKWLPLAATVKSLNFIYPIGCGPSSQATTRNVFRLPAGYIRPAPQDPKAGAISYLGAPSGLAYNDWTFQGDYIVSSDTGPLMLRFVADVTKVSALDDMFCEGLACRIAVEVCERLTQSTSKLGTIASAYKLFMTDARLCNSIETGAEEPPEDDWVSCRG